MTKIDECAPILILPKKDDFLLARTGERAKAREKLYPSASNEAGSPRREPSDTYRAVRQFLAGQVAPKRNRLFHHRLNCEDRSLRSGMPQSAPSLL
jgi:hypothetical protein